MLYPPVQGSLMSTGQGTPVWGGTPHGALIWPHPVYMSQQEDRFDGLFLHSAHRALMSLGLLGGGIIAFILAILGRFPFSGVVILSTDKTFWYLCPCSHVLRPDVVDHGSPMHSTVHLKG